MRTKKYFKHRWTVKNLFKGEPLIKERAIVDEKNGDIVAYVVDKKVAKYIANIHNSKF